MQIFRNLEAFQKNQIKPLVLGIGNFDGFHLGHQRLLAHVVRSAEREKGTPAVLTFQNHPQHVLHPGEEPHLLMASDYRLFHLHESGIEVCFWLPFTQQLSMLAAEDFIERVLLEQLGVKEVCMGYNARFGHERRGDGRMMRSFSEQKGFLFEEIEAVERDGEKISSTRIRKFVEDGEFLKAEKLMGHPYRIMGTVIKGDGRGTSLGFPTANLRLQNHLLPPSGVYPVKVRLLDFKIVPKNADMMDFCSVRKEGWLSGVMNLGRRPTFQHEKQGGSSIVPEIHLFDFEGNLYEKTLEIQLFPRIREEKTFPDVEDLKKQIQRDVQEARQVLQNKP